MTSLPAMTETEAEAWLIAQRWPHGVRCPYCDSLDVFETEIRNPGPFRCRNCKRYFGVYTQSVMHRSHLPFSAWVRAFHLVCSDCAASELRAASVEMGVSDRAAWHILHRIAEMYNRNRLVCVVEDADGMECGDPAKERPVVINIGSGDEREKFISATQPWCDRHHDLWLETIAASREK